MASVPIFRRADFKNNDRPVSELVAAYLLAGLTGDLHEPTPEERQLEDYRERCRQGDPFPLIAMQWPELLITDPDEAKWFEGEIGNPDNPCLRLDTWQRNDVILPFFNPEYFVVAVKGNTKAGKGASISMCVNLWYDVFPAKIILTSARYEHAKDVMFGEVAKWRQRMRFPAPGRLNSSSIDNTRQHYITVSNPKSGEGFSGQHGDYTLFVLDEACHDEQTEVLSDRGWIRFPDITSSDKLLTMNPETRETFYEKPTSVHASYREGDMWLYQLRNADFCVTPNHKMLYQQMIDTPRWSGWRLAPIENLSNTSIRFSSTVSWQGVEPESFTIPEIKGLRKTWPARTVAMEPWLTFLGWYFSEGSFNKVNGTAYTVRIYQKCPKTREEIAECIKRIGFDPRPFSQGVAINSRQLAAYLEQFGANCLVKSPPRFIGELSPRLIRIFLRSYLLGDGYIRNGDKSGKSHGVIYTSSKAMADVLQELALKGGLKCSVKKRKLAGKSHFIFDHTATSTTDGYVVYLFRPTQIHYRKRLVQRIPYKGMVYCAHMPSHHTMLTRRNGHVLWSGNSSIDDGRFDDATKQARKIVAAANPRTLYGWFRNLFRGCNDINKTQTVDAAFGRTRCITVGGSDCLNVRAKRLERPVAPFGGIEINGRHFAQFERIPPEYYTFVKPLIPEQCDYARFQGILQHPDKRHVAIFGHGHFPEEDPDKQVILGSWLERHEQAWLTSPPGVEAFSLDVARSQDGDETCLAAGGLQGVRALHTWQYADTMFHAGEAIRIAKQEYGIDLQLGRNPVVVDMDGLGAGTGDRLRELGVWVIEFRGNASSQVDSRIYGNLRAEAYGTLGRRLNPEDKWGAEAWALPPNDSRLREDLTAPEKLYGADPLRWHLLPKNKPHDSSLSVPSIKEKLGRSPDRGDSVAYLWHGVRELHMLNALFAPYRGDLVAYPYMPEKPAEKMTKHERAEATAEQAGDLMGWLNARYSEAEKRDPWEDLR